MNTETNKKQVDALSTPYEITRFAREGNYAILYRCVLMYQRGDCTWEQAMQVAAVSQAVALGKTAQQVVDLLNASAAPLRIIPIKPV